MSDPEHLFSIFELLTFLIRKKSDLGRIYAEVKFIADDIRNDDKDAEYDNEWKYAATVFDR